MSRSYSTKASGIGDTPAVLGTLKMLIKAELPSLAA
ncbi:Uncharacterised protein [Mycobacterium tuberculosis]|uniref:Uncharacterized protein n=1 Tax=Mycobacterium tuberculosis TaxID=1773 RepID=A0A0U0T076_MYCTX|nr:Uncharacterised protein [Mycobacterium tuberculosis]CNV46538.1 Uncharacterised protein [Mycobacterium tuberculosis]CNV89649.1 Uncharacterised protein [Mycobacterium tuberculosis]COV28157.1 Uncharacterised protein [Mycobacterium tuberculosis]COW56874.1 Uncharacterised protein [Mycobacterium tuberculosis]